MRFCSVVACGLRGGQGFNMHVKEPLRRRVVGHTEFFGAVASDF